ncbi:heterokaryon incompatibility protein-domain-containing protein [Podospora didyma]|uniref:Heterokaryon incompatibility protein-domain-containing protein n=1 Tax=Podospora didyma TaxID=330526 RepID=A0AAE0KIZ3_9PEZI|nr:heterokaryon incompatibility protein-domain-containing protein [Podospora didyma]
MPVDRNSFNKWNGAGTFFQSLIAKADSKGKSKAEVGIGRNRVESNNESHDSKSNTTTILEPQTPSLHEVADTDTLCSQCASLNLSNHKFTARTTLTTTTRTSTTTVVPAEFDSTGFDPAHLGTLDQIYRRSTACAFCRLIYDCTHSDTGGDGIGHDGLDAEGKQVSCQIEWHLDSRAQDSRPTTRRMLVFNEHGAFPEFYVVPVAPSSNHDAIPVGRAMDRDAADMRLLMTWLQSCQNEHTDCSNHQKANLAALTIEIRLIDVFALCIRVIPPGETPSYASLSYVWGQTQQMMLQTDNTDTLHAPGGLLKFRLKIPPTIWNAFEVARQLGIPYIWVDALCISQDDMEDKARQIQVMDKIYQHAVLTICVAAGEGSQSGIPGVDGTSKSLPQNRETYRDLQLTTMRPVAALIGASRWDTRAWTFQERLLSTRCAIFTNAGLVWQCSTTTWREDMTSPFGDRTLWSLDSVGSPLRALMGNPLRSYTSCVRIYSSRKLTYLGDKLEAFNGLSTFLGRKLGSEIVFGLPSRYFDWALLWEPEDAGERIAFDYYSWRTAVLPSWSWCGWDHQVDWRLSTVGGPLFNLHEWLTEHTWIIWRIAKDQHWKLVHDSCDTVASTTSNQTTHTYQSKRWDGYGPSAANAYGRSDAAAKCRHSASVPLLHEIDCLPAPEMPVDGRLLFKTFTGFFTLSRKSMSKSTFQSALVPGLCRFGITDISGDWCGSIILDKSWMNSVGAVFEFAAVSDAKEFTLEELDTWTYYIPEERQQAEWYCFNALMLKWSPDGNDKQPLAERVGLAKIFQSSFFGRSFKPCAWKRIVMT